ncbi:MAG: SDR family oxidoreductase [Bacteroidota bacterium]
MHVIVTGSSRGIGKSICSSLLAKSHSVLGISRSLSGAFNQKGYTHMACSFDDMDQLEQLQSLFTSPNIPGILINNAGIFEEAPIECTQDGAWLENWDRIHQVNLRAPALLCKWAIESWCEHQIPGIIINIASRAAYRGDTEEFASYASSKGGLVAFTKSVARSFGKKGITAFTICPGFVETDMARNSIDVYGEEYLTQDLALSEIVPPEQIGELCAAISTGNLSHMTGQTFHINSGSYLV